MHPSLEAEFIAPPPLEPKASMGRNEPCWCGSGAKWKKCHRNRHLQKPVPIGKLINEMRKSFQRGLCLHPEAGTSTCSPKPIKAHTIQRRGGLEAIAEDGHVISGKKGYEQIYKNDGEVVPQPLGIGSASTFMGFCGAHDNKLFEPIEINHYILDSQTAFLLAYRATAYEYLTKRNAVETIDIQRGIDRGKDFQTQIQIQQDLNTYKTGCLQGMRELKTWKEKYDRHLLAGNLNSIQHYALEFDGVLPFVCCGGFHPEVSFDGKQLQILSRSNVEMEHVCLNISVMDGKSFVVFAWLGKAGGPAEQFIESFAAVPSDEKANMCLILAAEQVENTYYTPSWWNGISQQDRDHLVRRMRSGISPDSERTVNAYMNVKTILKTLDVLHVLGEH